MKNELITTREESAIDGKFKLGAVVRRSIASTVYESEFVAEDGRPRPAAIKIRELDAVTQWSNAMRLSHPNLLRLYAAGASVVDGSKVAWVAMERGDESLAGVLSERALTEDEVREMLVPAVAALRYLHKNGYAHGALKPSNVFSVRDQLKLSTDNARLVADGGAPEEDMRALGLLIVEALKSNSPSALGSFADIVGHCLEPDPARRWTADQLSARLHGQGDAPRLMPEPPIAQPPAESFEERPAAQGFPKWIVAGLAALVLIVLLWAVVRKGSSPPASVAPAPVVVHEAPPAASNPASAPVAPALPRPVGRKAGGWSVIVAAYRSHAAADKRVRSLSSKWHGFHLSVLERKNERAPYLVVLGENLSESEAESLRQRAVSAGLPRDTYIKKLT